MINNIQFTGNPIKAAITKASSSAIESFKASRQNINDTVVEKAVARVIPEHTQNSVAFARQPINDAALVDTSMVERVESFAISHGNLNPVVSQKTINYLA